MALKGKIYSIAKQHDDLNTNELFQSMIDKSAAQDTIVMDGRNIAAGSIFAEQIHAGAITAEHMNVGSLSAISTNIGEITAGIIRSRDSGIHINLNTGIINLSKPLTINSKPVATSEQVTQAVDGVDGKVTALSTRMSNAEIKIEPSAIITTVTGHTTFKDVKEKAESAKITLDSKSSTWDAKATTGYVDGKASTAETNAKSHADGKASTAEANAKSHAEKIAHVQPIDGTTKKFIHLGGMDSSSASINGYLVIKTPITSSYMTRVSISGYNYLSNNTNIDLVVGFYAYSSSMLQHSYLSSGDFAIERVSLARDSNGKAVIIIGQSNTNWKYPRVSIDEATIGYQTPPDSYKDGWSAEIATDISAYDIKVSNVGGGDVNLKIDSAQDTADTAKSTADTLKNTTVPQLVSRVNTAEQKITDTAIRNTVTSHSTFKTVQENASLAKSTLESKSSAWDAKATTGYVDGKATTAESNAKTHADTQASNAETRAKEHTDSLTGKNKWIGKKYDWAGTARITPTLSHTHGLTPIETKEIDDTTRFTFSSDYYLAHFFTNVYVENSQNVALTITHDDDCSIIVNGEVVYGDNKTQTTQTGITIPLVKGWNTIDMLLREGTGGDHITLSKMISREVDMMSAYIGGTKSSAEVDSIAEEIISVETRVRSAEQKITDKAITNTVTSSTTFKDVQSKASSAKETLDNKSGTWDSKATTNYVDGKASTAETNAKSHADSKASTAETNAKDYAKKQVDGIEIGGRNLLTETSEEELRVLTSSFAIGAWDPGLTIGEEYTFSFDIKSENATYLQNVFLNSSNSGFVPNHPITKEWTRVQFTFKWEGGTYSGIELRPHVYPRPDYSGTYVTRIKLEKGNKVTDWTPAPEDVEEGIESAQSTADDAKSTADTLKNTTVPQLVSRVNTAEQKITDDAIRNTVTSSTTFKDIESKANSAKSTLDSKSKTWDAKIDSSTAEQIAEQKAQEAKSKNFGYRYYESIVIYGDSDKYYPVIIKGGDQNVKRDILIKRGYSEQAPPDWNTSTHKGGLTLKIKTNFGGWGGANYSWEIHELEEMYSRTFAGAQNVMSNMAFAIFLRGGGTTGARYHIYSDQSLTDDRYSGSNGIPISPQIGLAQELIGQTGTYSWNAPKFRTITANVEEEIRKREFIKLSQDTDSDVNSLKTTTIPQLTSRVNTAEQKITDKAIVSTVTESSTYKNEMTGKVSVDEVISRINQTSETISIEARRINLQGAVTFSSFGTDVTNKLDDIESDASNALTRTTIHDRRNDNRPPSWYLSNYPRQVVQEFKTVSVMGVGQGVESYGILSTTIQYADSSGGRIKQEFKVGKNIYTRSGAGASWDSWTDPIGRTEAWSYNGTTEIDGKSIKTGTLEANKITTGVLKDLKNNTRFDLTNGTFNIGNKFTYDGSTLSVDADNINLSGKVTFSDFNPGLQSTVDSKVTQLEIDKSIDKIEIGGRNLILNTSFDDFAKLPSIYSDASTGVIEHSYNFLIYEMSNLGVTNLVFTFNKQLERNTEYVLSFSLYSPYDMFLHDISLREGTTNESMGNNSLSLPPQEIIGGKEYNEIEIIFQTDNFGIMPDGLLIGGNSPLTTEIVILNVKLEKGNKPTNWTPAPEDVEGKIDTVQSTADTALNRVTIKDTRKTNQSPSWYYQNYPSQIVTETKEPGAVGFSGTTMGTMTTVVPGPDSSHGSVKQTFRTGSESWRRSGTTSWTGWANYDRDGRQAKAGLEEVEGKINNAVTTIDNTGVTVKDGSFFLEDDNTDTKYSLEIKKNLIKDHSFESVQHHQWANNWAFRLMNMDDMDNPHVGGGWYREYDPWITLGGSIENGERVGIFGKSIIVNNKDIIYSMIPASDGQFYAGMELTLSFHTKAPIHGLETNPRVVIELSNGESVRLKLKDVAFPMNSTKMSRHSTTFVLPSDYNENADMLKITLMSNDFTDVVYDGIQLVEGSHPVQYDLASETWDLRHELGMNSPNIRGNANYGGISPGLIHTHHITVPNDQDGRLISFMQSDGISTNMWVEEATVRRKLDVYGNVDIVGDIVGSLQTAKTTGKTYSTINATENHSNRWNSAANSSLKLRNSNNALSFIVGGTSNNRHSIIQGGHSEAAFAQHLSNLHLNKLGGTVYVGAGLSVSGTKNAIHVTRDGLRATPAYEMAESYLGDMGEDKTGLNNKVKIMIDTLFFDTINTDYTYHVFLQAHSNNNVWVEEREKEYFVIASDSPEVSFSWEMKAKRRGFEKDRLVRDDEITYEDIQTMQEYTGVPDEDEEVKA